MAEGAIKDLVAQHVDVKLVSLPRDKESNSPRGFCFVDVGSEEQIEQAVNALDGSDFGGRTIRVKRSVPKDQVEKVVAEVPQVPEGYSRLYVANLPFEATREEMVEFFTSYGEVNEVFIPMNRNKNINKGYAFVTLKDEDVAGCLEKANGAEFQGRELIVSQSLAPGEKAPKRDRATNKLCKLFVGNLSFYTIEETLTDLFTEFGEVVDCYLPKDMDRGGNTSRGFGFVTMAREAAMTAMSELDGCEIDGRNIQINEAQAKVRREKNEY
jgi:RNA recognition motif-containing protein